MTRDQGLDSLISDFTVSDIPWPGGRKLYEWWDSARGKRRFPSRAQFSPSVMRPYLRTMVLHEVEKENRQYRIRLAGTAFTELMGSDPTGKKLSDIPNTQPLAARYDWAVRNRKPYMCVELPLGWAHKHYRSYSTLVLPLGNSDDRVDMLIANIELARI